MQLSEARNSKIEGIKRNKVRCFYMADPRSCSVFGNEI